MSRGEAPCTSTAAALHPPRRGPRAARKRCGDPELIPSRQGALYTLLLRILWAGSQHGLKYHLESGYFVYPYDVKLKGGEAFLNPCHVGLAVTCSSGPRISGVAPLYRSLLFRYRRLQLLARLALVLGSHTRWHIAPTRRGRLVRPALVLVIPCGHCFTTRNSFFFGAGTGGKALGSGSPLPRRGYAPLTEGG